MANGQMADSRQGMLPRVWNTARMLKEDGDAVERAPTDAKAPGSE
jgi:hypothetical protein